MKYFNTDINSLTTITTGQLNAGTATGATAFVPALAGRKKLTICNSSASVGAFIGATGVAAGTGHYLAPGASKTYEANADHDGGAPLAYFVITASGNALCTYEGLS